MAKRPSAEEIIELYKMEPIPLEGAYFCGGFYSDILIPAAALPERYRHSKRIYGSILFLITKDSFSRMHSLPTDELYHFYMGDAVEQLQLLEDGSGRIVRMGHDIVQGEVLQALAPAKCWHGTKLVSGGEWALMGTSMSPAWDDTDYSDGQRVDLLAGYPAFEREIIERT